MSTISSTFLHIYTFVFVVCCTHLLTGPRIFFCTQRTQQVVLERPCCPAATNNRKTRKEASRLREKTKPTTSTFQKMATQSDTNVEIRKFDGKNFALWKERMQEVLIIRRQAEAICQSDKPTSMSAEEWRSMDKITRSTIRMHLTKNFYSSMAKETTTFSLWEKLHAVYKKSPH